MKSMMRKNTLREIRGSLGRYIAIFSIIALGVGFFSGLRVTRRAMIETGDRYTTEYKMFDYRLLSTLGFDEADLEEIKEFNGIAVADGAVSEDFVYTGADGAAKVIRAHSMTDGINELSLKSGHLPTKDNECVGDSRLFTERDIGTKITLSTDNAQEITDKFKYKEYTLVGLVDSPYYLNFERGSTTLGTGRLAGFVYMPYESFNVDYFTEIFVKLTSTQGLYMYSDEYNNAVDSFESKITALIESRADARYEDIYSSALDEINSSQAKLDSAKAEYEQAKLQFGITNAELEVQLASAQAEIYSARLELDKMEKPQCYALTRNTNIGYVSFDNDSKIVDGISTVFPIFFLLVAVLVCTITMNRMVDEQRTQIGIFKALGYSTRTIMGKYVFYAGSAAVTGCVFGYFFGIFAFPWVIWNVYDVMYGFAPIAYVIDVPLAVISLAVSLLCSVGTAWLSCRKELSEAAAQLMRPKAPKSGKRIFLERITFIWKRLKFLHKVSARNIFRYTKRFIMMVLGIGGCTALLITGFGLKDSIENVVGEQFEKIMIYDYSVSLSEPLNDDFESEFSKTFSEVVQEYCFVYEGTMDVDVNGVSKSITVIAPKSSEHIGKFVDLHSDERKIAYPKNGEAVISRKFAEKNNINIGDTISAFSSDMKEIKVTVADICDNHIYAYLYVSIDTFYEQWGEYPDIKTVYASAAEGDDLHQVATKITEIDGINGVTVNDDVKESFTTMMQSLNYVVIFVTFCAGALAFIVLYNLTNINITERIREIATIKVLGFNSRETSDYIFREMFVLTGIGTALGLGLGVLLHSFVMAQIDMDIVSFNVRISFWSFLASVVLTFAFACIVNIAMYFKLEKINMAESLKSIE